MRRSQVNAVMKEAIEFLDSMMFRLPPFAFWGPEEWHGKGPECSDIVDGQLGWDITDFGSGDFVRKGLFLFTIRNGTPSDLETPMGKCYAEKIMIVREGQTTPTHFHYRKMEDIINRGGGNLAIRLWNSTEDFRLAQTQITVSMDGVRMKVAAGGTLTLGPGESVCLPQRLYHRFWAEEGKGTVLMGEVSRVNDDLVDNRFFDPVSRFPDIEEDEEPLHLLCGDYKKYYGSRG